MSDWHLYTMEDERAHEELLDAVNRVACLLQPYVDASPIPGYLALDGEELTEEGGRGLSGVVQAIDDVLADFGRARDTHLATHNTMLPLRWSIHAMELAYFHRLPDFPVPANSAAILHCAFDQVRELAEVLRSEAQEIAKALDAAGKEEVAHV